MTYRHLHFPTILFFLAFYSLPCRAETGADMLLPEAGLSIIDGVILSDDRDLDDQELIDIELVESTDFVEPEDANQAELEDSINQYVDRVLKLEIENGAYNNNLSEALVGLGLSYSAAGKHKEALNVYSRALHIKRVNDGLQNLSQVPILELVIQANTELGDYKNLAKNYGYLLWVYNRNYEYDDPELIPLLQRLANWHLEAYEQTTRPDSAGHIIMASNLFSRTIEIIEANQGPYSPELISPLYGIVTANFKLIEPFGFIPNIDSFIGGKISPLLPSDFNRDNPASNFARNSHTALNYDHEHLNRLLSDQKNSASLIQNSYRSGRNALERIVDIHNKNPELPGISHAYAHTHLADWYLRFYKRSNATANYAMAYQLMVAEGYATEGDSGFFGYPRSLDRFRNPQIFKQQDVLPDLLSTEASIKTYSGTEETPLTEVEVNEGSFVLAQFNVSEFGVVRNLDILDSDPADNVRFRRMARNIISATPFRPRLENGKPTVTENVKMLYRFK